MTPEAEVVEGETTALVPPTDGVPSLPATRGPLALTTPTVLKERLAIYSEARAILLVWIDAHLIAGVDYLLIHQKTGPRGNKKDCSNKDDRLSKSCDVCHSKAGLLKPGSEQIAGLFQLKPRFREDTAVYAMLGSPPGTICLICELVDQGGEGVPVAEGRGARTKDQEYGDVNKCIKMAEKSAQIDATLRFGGLSHIFAQDTEDVKKGEKIKAKADKEAKAAAKAPPPPDPNVPLLTEAQVCDIDTLLQDVGYTEKALLGFLGYGARLEEVRKTDYLRALNHINAQRSL